MDLICDTFIADGTIDISHAHDKALRHNYRMAYELLLSRIEERLRALGLSERKACLMAGVGVNSIRHLRPPRQHAPKATTLAKLAEVLKVPPAYFLDAAAESAPAAPRMQAVALQTVFVRGAVQAGNWREAIEWDPGEWFPVSVPSDERVPLSVPRFGLLVRGNSMDRIYPHGTVVIVVRYQDLGRVPRTGDKVVVLRRSRDSGEFEATLKEYELDKQGRHVLWPRSTAPEFQTPIMLMEPTVPLADGDSPIPPTIFAEPEGDTSGETDLVISGLVIGSYKPEDLS
jgi:transcriptional regulator with XRE-family HTH domain